MGGCGGGEQICSISTSNWICNLINLGVGVGVCQEVGEGGSPNPVSILKKASVACHCQCHWENIAV